jgi:uncharacterized lipoprotein YbaY
MPPPTDRRTVILAGGAAALTAAAATVSAQSTDIRGNVTFQGGATIPAGRIEIVLEDSAIEDRAKRQVGETRVSSDGVSKSIGFTLARPESLTSLSLFRIVARLEREDGWLLARGSAQLEAGLSVNITLNEVIY